jgi:transcriptional regulator with XRE-family HTH domain
MKQPETGKKISELRKEKGLTQAELAAKCKISVRTIQRIELAEVEPRYYTLKIIFSCLGYDFSQLNGKSSDSSTLFHGIQELKRSTYLYLKDLFNLKTNTMRKILILSVPFLALVTVMLFSFNFETSAQGSKEMTESFQKASSNSDFLNSFNNGKLDIIIGQYADDACMMPDQVPTLNNKQEIARYWNDLYASGLRFSDIRSTEQIVDGSIAVDRGTWTVRLNQDVTISGTYLMQWRFKDGEWKIENEMTKADVIPGL